MSFAEHRKRVFFEMEDNSMIICYSGQLIHTNEDEYYPFEVNSQFFYLTGIERSGMVVLMSKIDGECHEYLFIEDSDPSIERWTGKMMTEEEATDISGIETVMLTVDFPGVVEGNMSRAYVDVVYFDTFRQGMDDMPNYNIIQANKFKKKYPAVMIKDLHRLVLPVRRVKDHEEIGYIKEAIDITRQGLEFVLSNLKPGMMEYEVQADFEYICKRLGTKKFSFPTIAGSGYNGCMLHYETNEEQIGKGELILLDLGAKYNNYCSDITRTYPASGQFTPRQRAYYDLVLKANEAVAQVAAPGKTLKELQDVARRVLGEGLVEMGKISSVDEVSKYYMHGVSHTIGIDAHDINLGHDRLEPGWIISNEPGLYIDEEEIGIRIEDDLLITEEGCVVLSEDIIKDADEIELFMARRNNDDWE